MTSLPLDQQETTIATKNGGIEKASVLDRRFMLDINFLQYNAFPIHEQNESPIEKEWHQEIKIMCYDLEILLSFPHDKFWVQLIHDQTVHAMLSTYLQKAPRSWDIWSIPEKFLPIHNKLNRLIFCTLLRMSTDKESKDTFLSPEAFGFTIYENYMFDIPKIIDICSLYGHPHGGNGILVNKMLTNIFTKQVGYVDDLKVAAQQLTENVLTNITSKYDGALTTIGLYDLLCYHYDTCMSLICLFSTYPPTMSYFNSSELITSFATLYAHLFHDIKAKLKRMSTPTQDLKSFKSIINRGQLATVRLIHCVIWHSSLMDQLFDDRLSASDHTRCAEQFIAKLSAILGDVQLMTTYYHECNLPKTFTIIKNSKAEVEQVHFNYILNAIEMEKSPERDVRDLDKVHYEASNHALKPYNLNGNKCQSVEDADIPNADIPNADIPNIDFLITNIKNIFPQYSSDFLKKCLAAYSYSNEDVITALLENNLPPHLEASKWEIDDRPGSSREMSGPSTKKEKEMGLNKSAERSPSKTIVSSKSSDAKKAVSLLSARQNVFDNDEFDVFNNPHELNFERIHIGKKSRTVNGQEVSIKTFLQNNPKLNFEYDEYEDEYDDTYDGLAAAADDSIVDEPPEFVIKPLNARLGVEEEQGSSGVEDDNPSSSTNEGGNSNSRSRGGRGRYQQSPRPRVEDKKGQKADEKVLQQRRRDEQHKGNRANHNRKRGADKKRRGGMIHM